MYSNYKHHVTYVLLGIASSRAITFISELYEGSISDKKIVKRSGILNKNLWDDNDSVMADRGFTIQNELQLTLENSNTQFLELFDSTNKFFGPFFGTLRTSLDKQNSRYLEISNISVGRTKLLDPWTISSGSLKLSF